MVEQQQNDKEEITSIFLKYSQTTEAKGQIQKTSPPKNALAALFQSNRVCPISNEPMPCDSFELKNDIEIETPVIKFEN